MVKMRAEYVAKCRVLALNTGFCVGGKERGGATMHRHEIHVCRTHGHYNRVVATVR